MGGGGKRYRGAKIQERSGEVGDQRISSMGRLMIGGELLCERRGGIVHEGAEIGGLQLCFERSEKKGAEQKSTKPKGNTFEKKRKDGKKGINYAPRRKKKPSRRGTGVQILIRDKKRRKEDTSGFRKKGGKNAGKGRVFMWVWMVEAQGWGLL